MWIYKTTNLINNKIYIGQTRYIDNDNYFGSGNLILQAVKKYGKENFKKEILDSAKNQEELDEKEKKWIKFYNSQDKSIGYNIADGGYNVFTMNAHIKEKISKALKGKYVGENAFRFGIPLTEKHKNAISIANKGKTMSDETRKKLSIINTGKKHSLETRLKLSIAHTGKKLSIEHRLKISESGKGRKFSEYSKTKLKLNNINKKQIHSISVMATNLETKEILHFNNLSEASRFFNKARQTIKLNRIKNWDIQLENPQIPINKIRNK